MPRNLVFVVAYHHEDFLSAGLAHGHGPYQLQFPNIYPIYPHARFYGPGVLETGRVVCPYPPLTVAVDLPFGLARRGWGRAAAVAAAVVVAGFLPPFALWDAHELWRDVAVAQLHQPFLPDALSWLAAWARWHGGVPTAALGFVLGAAVLGLTLLRQPSLRRAAAIAGAALLVFLLFNKQAFCNYYWLAVGVLATAAALDLGADAGQVEKPA